MTRSIPVRIAGAVLATGAAAAFALAGAGAANAGPQTGQYLAPNGGQVCSNSQYAGYQVRGIGTATFDSYGNGGAKFKLMKNGSVVANTPTRVGSVLFEQRSAWGHFNGAGYYQLCAVNTGNSFTFATVQIQTDGELGRY